MIIKTYLTYDTITKTFQVSNYDMTKSFPQHIEVCAQHVVFKVAADFDASTAQLEVLKRQRNKIKDNASSELMEIDKKINELEKNKC